MRKYLLSVYQPDGDPPSLEVLVPIMADLDALAEEMRAASAWIFLIGPHPASTATVVRDRDGEALPTDGPFTEARSTSAASRSATHRTSTPRGREPRGWPAPPRCRSRYGPSHEKPCVKLGLVDLG